MRRSPGRPKGHARDLVLPVALLHMLAEPTTIAHVAATCGVQVRAARAWLSALASAGLARRIDRIGHASTWIALVRLVPHEAEIPVPTHAPAPIWRQALILRNDTTKRSNKEAAE